MPTGLGDEKLWLCPSLDDSADDISGNGNHGTYNGGMGTVADTSSGGTRAYSFDGVDDYISTGNDVSANSTRSFSCWVYLDTQASRTFVASCYTSGGTTSQMKVAIGVNSSLQPYAVIQNGGAIANAQSSSALSTSQWYHITGVFTSGSTKVADLYVDGVLDTTGSGTGTFPPLDETLVGVTARSNGALIAFMDGLQDDIRIFDRALSTSEITHLATSRGIEGSPYTYSGLGDEKLWLCPSLDDSADDISGNGNHGTYNGGMGTVADTSNGGTRAYSFDGSDDYIEVPDDDAFSFTNGTADTPFSISAWVKVADHLQNRPLISKVSETAGTSGHEWILTARPSGDLFRGVLYTYNNPASHERLDTTTSLGTSWKHVVFTSDGSNLSFYLDGSSVSATQTVVGGYSGMTNQSKPVRVGTFFVNDATYKSFFYGLQDDIRIFDRALTTSEITALASKRGYEVPAASASSGSTPHPLSAPIFHPLG